MLPVVVIELPPGQHEAPLLEAMTTACTEVVAEGRCVIAGGEQAGAGTLAVAIVRWTDAEQVLVEVGVRLDDGDRWLSRDLGFRPGDAPTERWRSVGLTIGSLVGEVPSAEKPAESLGSPRSSQPSPAPAPATPEPVGAPRADAAPPVDARTGPSEPLGGWIGAGALAGPGFSPGPWRIGGWLAAGLGLGFAPLRARVEVAQLLAPRNDSGLSGTWTWLGASLGPELAVGSALLLPRLGVRAVRVGVRAEDPADGSEGTASRWTGGLALGLGLALPREAAQRITLGAELTQLGSSTRPTARGQPLGVDSDLQLTLWIGAQVFP